MNDAIDPDLLRRLREGDPVARGEFADLYLPEVTRRLLASNQGLPDDQLIYEAASQAVFDMLTRPHVYDPDRLPIMSYLMMAARGDLKNLLDKERRRSQGRTALELVENTLSDGNDDHTGDEISPELMAMFERVLEAFPDERDRRAVQLMADGERKTSRFAQIFGVQYEPKEVQQREVNKHKDRIKQKIRRLRKELLHERD